MRAIKKPETKHEVECVGADEKPETRVEDCYRVYLDNLQQNSLACPKLDAVL